MREALFRKVDFTAGQEACSISAADTLRTSSRSPRSTLTSGSPATPSPASRRGSARQKVKRLGPRGPGAVLNRDSAKDEFPGAHDLVFGFEVAHHVPDKRRSSATSAATSTSAAPSCSPTSSRGRGSRSTTRRRPPSSHEGGVERAPLGERHRGHRLRRHQPGDRQLPARPGLRREHRADRPVQGRREHPRRVQVLRPAREAPAAAPDRLRAPHRARSARTCRPPSCSERQPARCSRTDPVRGHRPRAAATRSSGSRPSPPACGQRAPRRCSSWRTAGAWARPSSSVSGVPGA